MIDTEINRGFQGGIKFLEKKIPIQGGCGRDEICQDFYHHLTSRYSVSASLNRMGSDVFLEMFDIDIETIEMSAGRDEIRILKGIRRVMHSEDEKPFQSMGQSSGLNSTRYKPTRE